MRYALEEYRRLVWSGCGDVEALAKARDNVYRLVLEAPDCQLRKILYLRYIRCLSWQQVAISVGGGNTADGMRKRATRYASRT